MVNPNKKWDLLVVRTRKLSSPGSPTSEVRGLGYARQCAGVWALALRFPPEGSPPYNDLGPLAVTVGGPLFVYAQQAAHLPCPRSERLGRQ